MADLSGDSESIIGTLLRRTFSCVCRKFAGETFARSFETRANKITGAHAGKPDIPRPSIIHGGEEERRHAGFLTRAYITRTIELGRISRRGTGEGVGGMVVVVVVAKKFRYLTWLTERAAESPPADAT